MSAAKDRIKDLIDQVKEDDEVLQRVQHLLEYALGTASPYAADDEVVCYDIETGVPMTMHEHTEMMDREVEEADRDGTWITLEEAKKQASKW